MTIPYWAVAVWAFLAFFAGVGMAETYRRYFRRHDVVLYIPNSAARLAAEEIIDNFTGGDLGNDSPSASSMFAELGRFGFVLACRRTE